MVWTTQSVSRLNTLWENGYSAERIAREMGATKWAVYNARRRFGITSDERYGLPGTRCPHIRWTDEKIEKLIRMKQAGFTGLEIAKALGCVQQSVWNKTAMLRKEGRL